MRRIILLAILVALCHTVDVGVNFDVDVVELLKWAGTVMNGKEVYSERQDSADERFVSYLGDGKITACYFHKKKRHQVTVVACENAGIVCKKRSTFSTAVKGRWACAKISKGIMGNKSYYKTLE